MIPFWLPLFPMACGPRVPSDVTARDLLAEHLEWARRTRRPPQPPDDDDGDEASFEAGDAQAEVAPGEALGESEVREIVKAAAVELSQAWQEDVLGSIPSRFMFTLCAFADRAAYLLEEAAPDVAREFRRLRDVFMEHSQGREQASDADLGRAVDDLEAAVAAVERSAVALLDSVEEIVARISSLPVDGEPTRIELWVPDALTLRGKPVSSDLGMAIIVDALLAKRFSPAGFRVEAGGRVCQYDRK